MEEETGSNSSVAEPDAKVESVSTETPADAKDSSTKETEAQEEGGTDTVAVLEKRFKDTQAELTRSRQELAELRKQRDMEGADVLKSKILDLEKKLDDPEWISKRQEEAARRREEEESLSPEQKEIRQLKLSQAATDRKIQVSEARDVYIELMEKDEFFEKYMEQVSALIRSDNDLRTEILRNPARGYKIAKGLLVDDVRALEKDQIRKELEAEEAEKIAAAKRKKTSMSASTSSKGTSASTNVASGNRSVSDLVEEWYRNNPSGDKK